MKHPYVSATPFPDTSIFDGLYSGAVPAPVELELEVTARCNNACRHCYINLPAGDDDARGKEMSLQEIDRMADEAVSMGTLWCLMTGGEPLLREDFREIYMCLKRKGLLVSVFTNATLITPEHIRLFRDYPPRDLEVTVYGVTRETYERVTRVPGSYDRFMAGLNGLLDAGVKVRLKAVAIRSNVHELPAIARFCRERTTDYFRFDPWLHLRLDHREDRNEHIRAERLTPEEFVAAEGSDEERLHSLGVVCRDLESPPDHAEPNRFVFRCGAGRGRLSVSYDGMVRVCSAMNRPDCIYNLREGSLDDAYHRFFPQVLGIQSGRQEFMEKCSVCELANLCMWCPAHSYLETGEMDTPVDYFCKVAHARVDAVLANA